MAVFNCPLGEMYVVNIGIKKYLPEIYAIFLLNNEKYLEYIKIIISLKILQER